MGFFLVSFEPRRLWRTHSYCTVIEPVTATRHMNLTSFFFCDHHNLELLPRSQP